MLKLLDIHKEFSIGSVSQKAVEKVSFELAPREFVILSGRSGSGKTTLLNIIGGLEHPDQGKVIFENQDMGSLDDDRVSLLRRHQIGFIFQTFNLIPVLSAFENVEYPLLMLGMPTAERKERVHEILKKVGLEKQMKSKPGQLSGGQRQRVAIARALVKRPKLILADEPTANLDVHTSQEIVQLIQELFQEQQGSVIFCTHDTGMIGHGTRWLEMSDGHLIQDRRKA
ncbi:MAG: ABC transporter ATP-binding protein [Pseudobdellovibrionaceae bacterium]